MRFHQRFARSRLSGNLAFRAVFFIFEIKAFEKLNISSNELLMELRQRGVEHLGQVRLGLMETARDFSLYFSEQADSLPVVCPTS